ncbi:MAG: hypothetical protein M0C28_44355 [Candidatus Moduliflexus flocculans]|nr:hypothetical protein [Candidatus Moduliflexus flocculans]
MTQLPHFHPARSHTLAGLRTARFSGDGLKLERFGKYVFARPESQAMWKRSLDPEWNGTPHAVFQPTAEESGGHWDFKKRVDEKWEMNYPPHPTPLLSKERGN